MEELSHCIFSFQETGSVLYLHPAKGILPLGREHLQEKYYAQLLGGPILPVTEAPGLDQGNKIILHHSGRLLILREREESALCLPVTSCSLDGWMWTQPSH